MGKEHTKEPAWRAKAIKRGKLIKAARLGKKLTLEQVAEKLKCKHSAVVQWEDGETKDLKAVNAYNLAVLLDLDFKDLLVDEDNILSTPPDQAGLIKVYEGIEQALADNGYKLTPADKSLLVGSLSGLQKQSHTVADFKKAIAKLAARLSD